MYKYNFICALYESVSGMICVNKKSTPIQIWSMEQQSEYSTDYAGATFLMSSVC